MSWSITRETERKPRSKPLAAVVEDMENAAAIEAVERASDIWPGSGKSAPVVDGNSMHFTEAHAPYVRRSGDSKPLFDEVVPRIAREAADDTFDHFAEALSAAALRET